MPELRCTVETCAHNKQCCCDKGDIHVDGDRAQAKSETCCNSFQDYATTNYSNSCKSASCTSQIHCDAQTCKHNCDCVCHADNVEMQGSNACNCCDTECASFCVK